MSKNKSSINLAGNTNKFVIIDKLFRQGISFIKLNELEKAQKVFDEIIKLDSRNADALHLSGVIAAQSKKCEIAVEFFYRAIRINPQNPTYHCNRGSALKELNRFDEAITSFDKAIGLERNYALAYNNKGTCLIQLKLPEQALTCFEKALSIKPDYAEAFVNKGLVLALLNQIDAAIDSFKNAIYLKTDFTEAYFQLGSLYKQIHAYHESLNCFEKVVNIKHEYAEAWFNIGLIYEELSQSQKALDSYSQAIETDGKHSRAYFGKAKMLKKMMRLKEALKAYEHVIEIETDNYEAYSNMGNLLADLNQLPEAISRFDQAIHINPEYYPAYSNKGIAYLRNGDYEKGRVLYENRFKTDFFSVPQLITDKSVVVNLNQSAHKKKVLIWAEQGIGDQIIYGSLINEALKILSDVQIMMDKRLIPLFERSIPQGRFIDEKTPLNEVLFDEQIPLGGLAKFFRGKADDFPAPKNQYLIADNKLSEQIRLNLLKDKKILCGISWSSNNEFFGKEKSLKLENLLPILKINNIQFVNLQYGDVADQLGSFRQETGVDIKQYSDIDNFHNIDGLASLVQACDFVVTVSNSTAHISGAIGKETYLLYARGNGSLWYWSNSMDGHSLWYPSISLY